MSSCDGSCGRTVWRTLSRDDADTLRTLRAAMLQRPLASKAKPLTALEPADRREMRKVADKLDDLARRAVADPARLAEMASWIRDNLPPLQATPDVVSVGRRFVIDHRAVFCAWMKEAFDRGYTLEAMAEVIGVTRERVRQLVSQAEPVAGLPPVVGMPVPPVPLPWPTHVPERWNRWPRPTLSDSERTHLIGLHRLGTQLRGQCGENDPRRIASEELTSELHRLVDEVGFTYNEVEGILGVRHGTVRARLARHGYRSQPPSQSKYRGSEARRSA